MSLLCPNTWLPDMTLATQASIRCLYGVLLLATLLRALPHARRFFMSERWGGYAESSPPVDLLQNPGLLPLVMAAWLISAVLLIVGSYTVPAALVNLVFSYYFFVWMRWRGVLRGMGAPGFMTFWLAAAVFFLELTLRHAPDARPLALLVFQVDYAFIMLSAGIYKLTAGYAHNNGMELGMINPQWGYWGHLWRRLAPQNPAFWGMNQLAWSTEVVAAVLMLIPATRLIGGLLMIGSFLFIATQIRLCLLCEMVIVGGMLFFLPGSAGQHLVDALPWPGAAAHVVVPLPLVPTAAVQVACWTYLLALPLAHAGLFYNFYANRRLWPPLQTFLEGYTNLFGLIIWRVFSADHTNFYVRIFVEPRHGGPRHLLSKYAGVGGRFTHVGENITVTSVFTSLKYYPSNNAIFQQRLRRYARTLPCPADSVLIFEYVSLRKDNNRFGETIVAEFRVDPATQTISERAIAADAACLRAATAGSPLKATSRPGSYAA
jgi:hypothetical protein